MTFLQFQEHKALTVSIDYAIFLSANNFWFMSVFLLPVFFLTIAAAFGRTSAGF